jgi:hypothetical protein
MAVSLRTAVQGVLDAVEPSNQQVSPLIGHHHPAVIALRAALKAHDETVGEAYQRGYRDATKDRLTARTGVVDAIETEWLTGNLSTKMRDRLLAADDGRDEPRRD